MRFVISTLAAVAFAAAASTASAQGRLSTPFVFGDPSCAVWLICDDYDLGKRDGSS